MTPRKSGPEERAHELLEMWMGEPADKPEPRRRIPLPTLLTVLAVAAIGGILLAKYAVDVLLIGLALVATGLVLHVLGTWLAESDLLSPGWFTILVLGAALAGWALFYPADGLEGLGRYVPRPLAKFFEWSESKGWGQRALIGPGGVGTGPRAGAPGSAPASPPSQAIEAPRAASAPGPALSLTASATTVRAGQAVVLTARMTGGSAEVSSGTVRFYDGLRLLGEAQVVSQGRMQVAHLTVTLPPGRYEITASASGAWAQRSERVAVNVQPSR